MKRFNPLLMAGLALATVPVSGLAQNEQGRVLSSTPIVQPVAVPRQACTQEWVEVPGQRSGGGAVLGAIAGGAMGQAVGDGSGRAAATAIGLIGGALLGSRLDSAGEPQLQNVRRCHTETFYENRTLGYQVVYEYAGRQYTVQLPQDPGPYVPLQVSPVGMEGPRGGTQVIIGSTYHPYRPAYTPPPVYVAPVVVWGQDRHRHERHPQRRHWRDPRYDDPHWPR